MRKVLIITYYWPPSGGAGVQRWLKFVKYLRDFGWEPVIYTPSNPEFPVIDESLAKDIPTGKLIQLKSTLKKCKDERGGYPLKPAKELIGDDATYDELRLARLLI